LGRLGCRRGRRCWSRRHWKQCAVVSPGARRQPPLRQLRSGHEAAAADLLSTKLFIGRQDRFPMMQNVGYSLRKSELSYRTLRASPVKIFQCRPRSTFTSSAIARPRIYGTVHSPGPNLALEGLREVLRIDKATSSETAELARQAGAWKAMRPYLEAMTANGQSTPQCRCCGARAQRLVLAKERAIECRQHLASSRSSTLAGRARPHS
jgi:hypothetical protein